MFTTRLFVMIVLVGMLAAANAALADGVRGAASKVLGDYDSITSLRGSRTQTVYRTMAPAAIAPTPEARRSFSAEPAPPAGSPCPQAQPSAPVAQQPAPAQRRYSIDPGSETLRFAPTRRMRSTPAYLLPKTDARKYRGF